MTAFFRRPASNFIIGAGSILSGLRSLEEGMTTAREGLQGLGLLSLPKKKRASRQLASDDMKMKVHTVNTIDERIRYVLQMVRKGRSNPKIRALTVKLLSQKCGDNWCVKEKDWPHEVRHIFNWIRKNVRYTRDPANVDLFQHPKRTLEFAGGDCFPEGTLLLTEGNRTIPIERVTEGMKIWGLDRWSTVQHVWFKGLLSVDAVTLNNGSTVKLTSDHKVYVLVCEKHDAGSRKKPCSCPVSERTEKRITVKELRTGMVLAMPSRIPFGSEKMDPDRALVEGLYISDGWCSHESDFQISGQDGQPKEAQKRVVAEICNRLGIKTTWQRKYISVLDKEWAQRMARMGHHAPEKHALSIDLDEGAAAALLRGIMADSGKNGCKASRTFTTTSRDLMIQVRLLHKMFGITCGYSYIVDHGGLGQHPVYRLSTRARSDGKQEKLLRVKSIQRGVMTLPCWDISTDDHRVYLPEHDVTVSNCDDYTITLGSMLQSVGYPIRLRVIRTKGSSDWNHIYLMCGLPPRAPTKWMPLDASVPKPAGWQPPRSMIAAIRDYEVT